MANLPAGYTELEYIESTGMQYIDTKVFPNGNTRFTVKCEFGVQTSAAWLFGSRSGTYVNTFNFLTTGNLYRSDYGNGSSGKTFFVSDPVLDIDKDKGKLIVNGITQDESFLQSFTSSKSLYFFANNNNGSVQGKCLARLFKASIFSSDSKVRDFIPCKNPSGEAGLYDLVSGSFFGNSGTGSFLAGPEIAPPETPSSFFQSASVVLRWSPVDCDGYRLYKNGSLLAETTETMYIDDEVSDGQDIKYSITAYRGSAESEPQTITVQIREGYTILTPIITSAFFQ